MKLVPAYHLNAGDMVDLEGDIYADPDDPSFEFELAVVEGCDMEGPTTVVVYFESTTIAMPVDHILLVERTS